MRVPDGCAAVPLNCGAPLGYLDWSMIFQLAGALATSGAGFAAAAAAIDACAERGWLKRFP